MNKRHNKTGSKQRKPPVASHLSSTAADNGQSPEQREPTLEPAGRSPSQVESSKIAPADTAKLKSDAELEQPPIKSPKKRPSAEHTEIVKDAVRAVLFAITLVLLRLPLDNTEPAIQFRQLAYNFTQWSLDTHADPNVSVIVVDSVNIKELERAGVGDAAYTPREPIRQLIEAIAGRHPRSIAVDVDFSPDEHGFIRPDDPGFFIKIQDISRKTGVPVFLGVYRQAALGRNSWLGVPDFANLAASIVMPRGRTHVLYTWTKGDKRYEPCITLAAALARGENGNSGHDEAGPIPRWLRWAAEAFIPQTLPGGEQGEGFVVDYGHLKQITANRIQDSSIAETIADKKMDDVRNRMVIIGDATTHSAEDEFIVANSPDPVPGTLIHACAADSLMRAPLLDFTIAGRMTVDLLVATCIVCIVAAMRWRSVDLEADKERHHQHHVTVTWIVVIAAFAVGVLMVQHTRVMWDDLPLLMVGLFAHRPFENWVTNLAKRARKKSARAKGSNPHDGSKS